MSNLFDISNDYIELISIIEENMGELTPELEQKFNEISETLDSKLNNLYLSIEQLKQEEETLKNLIEKLNKKNEIKTKQIESLKNYLKNIISNVGDLNKSGNMYKKTDLFKATIVPTEAVIVDENLIPNDFVNWSLKLNNTEFSRIIDIINTESCNKIPDKKRIKELLKNNILIQGAELKTNYNLRIT